MQYSDKRVFKEPFTVQRAKTLVLDLELAEKIEAFGSRFGRLQDTIGDKLLPAWLQAIGEKAEAFIDNLNKAEKLKLLESAERWMITINLRNKMVHEYIKDHKVLADALQSAHEEIEFMQKFAKNLIQDINRRNLI